MLKKNLFSFSVILYLLFYWTYQISALEIGERTLIEKPDFQDATKRLKEARVLRFRELVEAQREEQKSFFDRIDISVASVQNFDTNANFDTKNEHDGNSQLLFLATMKGPPVKWGSYSFSYNLDTSFPDRFPENTTFIQHAGVDVEVNLHKHLTLDSSYYMAYYSFPHFFESNYLSNQATVGFKHTPFESRKFYHRPHFSWELRNYRKQKDRFTDSATGNALISASERRDIEYTLGYEIGIDPAPWMNVTIDTQLGFNNSNDAHLDFYDYQYFRPSIMVNFLHQRWYSYIGAQYERKAYSSRFLTISSQRDLLTMLYGGVFYSFTPKTSLGATVIYYNNDSNDGDFEYHGFTASLGVYTNFELSSITNRIAKLIPIRNRKR